MRKRIIGQNSKDRSPVSQECLDLERLAQVEVTSEDAAHPIEAALLPGMSQGWRASQPGEQLIRLLFDEPLSLRSVRLLFYEAKQQRTQEFVLRWSSDRGHSYQEIVRQQYNFSPPETIREVEEYGVDLSGVTALELRIMPNISGGNALASLVQLCLV